MRLLFLGLFLSITTFTAIAEGEQSIGCFSSGKNNVKFVRIDRDGISLGYVKYQKSKVAIPLVYVSGAYEENEEGVPKQLTTKWAEFINGKISGYYTVVSQGARFYQIEYKSSTNAIAIFQDDANAYNSDGTDCNW
ncbi:hypothetical protein [Serratia rubidaea]|uniref:hypothetical protein n=1 Tax=Serratia rubidaea TaxID=61652 RepID=UPI00177F711C|nr:hypothetical protein [Serratia rubidaea]MBD8451527.1 hypothetical protein [Serratia rubidaea]